MHLTSDDISNCAFAFDVLDVMAWLSLYRWMQWIFNFRCIRMECLSILCPINAHEALMCFCVWLCFASAQSREIWSSWRQKHVSVHVVPRKVSWRGPWFFVEIICISNAKPIPSSTLVHNSKKSADRLLLLLLFLVMDEIKCLPFRIICSAMSAGGIYSLPRSTEHQWTHMCLPLGNVRCTTTKAFGEFFVFRANKTSIQVSKIECIRTLWNSRRPR